VERLLARYGADIKPLKSLGYRHLAALLQGRMGWEEAVEHIKRDTRRYAKRQLTWFRADPEVKWRHPDQQEEIFLLIKEFIAGP
jgi:tRNA dimethylallyltransferase